MTDVNTISTIARGVAQQVAYEHDSARTVSVSTSDATATDLLRITPDDQSAGLLVLSFAGFDSTNGITGIKAVRFKKVAGTLTLGTVANVLPTEADGLSASISIAASSGDILVQVIGVAATDMNWKAAYKFLNVVKAGIPT